MGDSKLGPYLTFTLFFFKDKKVSWAQLNEVKDNKNKVSVAKKNTNATKKKEATSKKVLKTKQPKPKKE